MADVEVLTDKVARKNSDLGVRTLSAFVMLAVAGGSLWAGGLWWAAFVAVVALLCLREFQRLVLLATLSKGWRVAGIIGAIVYIAPAALLLWALRSPQIFDASAARIDEVGLKQTATVLGLVIATDIGAYFSGRTLGGPKIAPAISPSKTWAGLLGGMLFAGLWCLLVVTIWDGAFAHGSLLMSGQWIGALASGAVLAVIAQVGDFFESWLKRKAGVKDSSNLIPGHGGVFDRIDGLMAVCFVILLFSTVGVEIL